MTFVGFDNEAITSIPLDYILTKYYQSSLVDRYFLWKIFVIPQLSTSVVEF